MQHYTSLKDIQLSGTWLTIGSFDGVHRGHQTLMKGLVEQAHAAGNLAVAMTFFPHPAFVVRGQKGRYYLNTPEEKAALLSEQGLDAVITLEFTREFSGIDAQDFMYEVHHRLGLKQLWVGFDFALGKGREGNLERLRDLGAVLGYGLKVIPPYVVDGEVVSSTLIRRYLEAGNVARVGQLLGRWYSLPGEVVTGDGRGRKIGIPTANLSVWSERVVPMTGVYAGWARIGEARYPAVTNIGYRPTFMSGPVDPTVEAHILDIHEDLYGSDLRFEFVEFLRGEQKFESAEALVGQIQKDIARTREILRDTP